MFGKNGNLGKFRVGDYDIVPDDNVKILGLNVDNKLNFFTHISQICLKAGRQVQVLSRLSYVLDQRSKMLLYNSFVDCYFNYCSSIWHFCSKTNTYKIEKLQEKALRFITTDFTSSYHNLLVKCNKTPLYVTRIRKFLEMAYKIRNNMCPEYLSHLITVKNVPVNLRSENTLIIPKYTTVAYGKNNFVYNGPFYWNTLPDDTKKATSLYSFKSTIQQWLPTCKCGFCVLCTITNQ